MLAGRLHRPYRGVYSLTRSLPTLEARLLAAVLPCGSAATLSDRAALVLWGICEPRAEPIDVTTPHRPGQGRSSIRSHLRRLPSSGVTRRRGVPVTTVGRSLLDFAAAASERYLQRAVDEGTYLRLLHPTALDTLLVERRGQPGTAALRRALGARDRPIRTRSELERLFLELIIEAGLERPLVNRRIRTSEGSFEVDFCWPGRRLIVETNGYRAHGPEHRFNADRDRNQRLGSACWRVYRFSSDQVFERPEQTARRVAALLQAGPGPR